LAALNALESEVDSFELTDFFTKEEVSFSDVEFFFSAITTIETIKLAIMQQVIVKLPNLEVGEIITIITESFEIFQNSIYTYFMSLTDDDDLLLSAGLGIREIDVSIIKLGNLETILTGLELSFGAVWTVLFES
jgi:hypothetical protein